MAWEWVGTVSTAVVGIAGIFGSIWTAERQRHAQLTSAAEERRYRSEELALDERKAVYVRVMKSRDDLLRIFDRYFFESADTGDVNSVPEVAEAFDALRLAVEEVTIIGPDGLPAVARRLVIDLWAYWDAHTNGEAYELQEELSSELVRRMREDFAASRARLARA